MVHRRDGGDGGAGCMCCIALATILSLIIAGCVFGAWGCTMTSEAERCQELWDMIQLFGIMSAVSIFFVCCCGCCTGMEEEVKRPPSQKEKRSQFEREKRERRQRMREWEESRRASREQEQRELSRRTFWSNVTALSSADENANIKELYLT